MFDLAKFSENPCLVDGKGSILSYAQVDALAQVFAKKLDSAGLFILGCDNTVATIVAYLAALQKGCAVMLAQAADQATLQHLTSAFEPRYVYRADTDTFETFANSAPVHPDLAILLSTSGSTGTAKAVRLSRTNILSNATSIAEYLRLDANERAALTLPFQYSYGMSVVNSHLAVGASIWLTEQSVSDAGFWDAFRDAGCTSFPGVPHTYQLLKRSNFDSRSVPALRHATQAGGHLSADLVKHFAEMSRRDGWNFFVMYGQTEAAPRMSYVPPEKLLEHPETIGIAIPGGRFLLEGANAGEPGELVYEGPNVMMGYATQGADLIRGNEFDALHTGDLAVSEPSGLYRIVGRKSRFIKPFGLRVSLDEVERRLQNQGIQAVAVGNDNCLGVYTTNEGVETIATDLSAWLKLPASSVVVRRIDEIPRAASGKVNFSQVNELFKRQTEEAAPPRQNDTAKDILDVFKYHFPGRAVRDSDSFQSLGGDSLRFIQFSLDLESRLGTLPDGWENLTAAELRELIQNRGAGAKISPFSLRTVDTGVMLRAYAIICVVTHHLNLWDWTPQGSALLLVLAGFSFGRFQFKEVLRSGDVSPIWSSIVRVAIPTIGYIAILQILHQKFFVWSLLLVGNVYETNAFTDQWYLDVYIQTLLVMLILLSIGGLRERFTRTPVAGTIALFAVGTAICALTPVFWNTEPLDQRVLPQWFWLFAWGLMIVPLNDRRKILASYVVFTIATFVFYQDRPLSTSLNLVIGAGLAAFVPMIKVPGFLRTPILEIASATLFIYLTHFQISAIAYAVLGKHPALGVIVALIGGILVSRTYAVVERKLFVVLSRTSLRANLQLRRDAISR